ncbi:hypothetical protein BU24DRAFT_122685 [Aaosphaeria arxii CBS 175.79]|uniref:Uncharacterized protein n=1 Tax=Aaosphaeria arxii CBS 175.79 TaxID=1450172 RepID=A0A6A5Y3Y2_9PLEO|nr:uncharacterized protein BU24DRAFT_122685 [Aaosphaeria arxii CBS 175.79]KAF2019581.1 hypothetical protein BU24DRAFT_122685 [Aaosphaeria arxii CBS 175.79]
MFVWLFTFRGVVGLELRGDPAPPWELVSFGQRAFSSANTTRTATGHPSNLLRAVSASTANSSWKQEAGSGAYSINCRRSRRRNEGHNYIPNARNISLFVLLLRLADRCREIGSAPSPIALRWREAKAKKQTEFSMLSPYPFSICGPFGLFILSSWCPSSGSKYIVQCCPTGVSYYESRRGCKLMFIHLNYRVLHERTCGTRWCSSVSLP